MNAQREFTRLARQAIVRGVLTPPEVAIIARTGTRKARYWARHLRDLRAIVEERRRGQGQAGD